MRPSRADETNSEQQASAHDLTRDSARSGPAPSRTRRFGTLFLQKNLVGWDKWGGVAEALGSVLERRDSTPKTVRESS